MNTEYKIVSEALIKNLVERVNKEIRDGWKPLGSPFIAHTVATFICQAMTRKNP